MTVQHLLNSKEKDGVIGKVGEKRGRFYKIRIEKKG